MGSPGLSLFSGLTLLRSVCTSFGLGEGRGRDVGVKIGCLLKGVAAAGCLGRVSCGAERWVSELLAGSRVSFSCCDSCEEFGMGRSEMAFLPSTKTLILRFSRSGPIFGNMNKCGISSMSLHSIINCQGSCHICFPGATFTPLTQKSLLISLKICRIAPSDVSIGICRSVTCTCASSEEGMN